MKPTDVLSEGLKEIAIRAINLTKRYGKILAVDTISFEVHEGEFFGLLGPNGAGKTTTIRLLTGLTRPTSGRAIVSSFDVTSEPVEAKRLMGVVPETFTLYSEMSVWDNIVFAAELYGVPRADRAERARKLLELFGLHDRRRDRAGEISKGMKRRLTIASALVHRPEVLFLDEPTIGLDVQSSRMIRKIMGKLNAEGTTIFLTTHYIEEADRLCDRVAIIDRGRLVTLDSPEKLKATVSVERGIEVSFDRLPEEAERELGRMEHINRAVRLRDKLRLYTEEPSEVIFSITDYAKAKGLKVISINILRPSLEDVFVELIGLTPVEIERMEQIKPKGVGGG